MRAQMTSMLFSFGKSKKKTEAPGQSKPGFMGSVTESVHGARLDGSSIVLWRGIGGGTYPCRPVGPWISEETRGGSFRLVFQDMSALGRMSGATMATVSEVSRSVALSVCRRRELTGMLSVYTPDREDARGFMAEVLGHRPVEYGFSVGCMEANMTNFRGWPWEGDERLPGPMCLFGDYIGGPDSLDEPANRDLLADFGLGYHSGGRSVMVLSADLGGGTYTLVDADAETTSSVADGEFRIIIGAGMVPFHKGDGASLVMSAEGISREDAMLVCSDRLRSSGLGVYTPRREDASQLMADANRGRRPTENRDVPELMGMSCFTAKGYDGMRPRAVFGSPPAPGV